MGKAKTLAPSDHRSTIFRVEQVLNSLSIVLANVYVAVTANGMQPEAEAAPYFNMIRIVAHIHCPCSAIYHLQLASRSLRLDDEKVHAIRETPLRLADLGALHVCATVISFALSQGNLMFFFPALAMNSVCLTLMVLRYLRGYPAGAAAEMTEFLRVGVCIIYYVCALLLRGLWSAFLVELGLFLLMGALMCFVHPFGHALSRIPLAVFVGGLLDKATSFSS
mmetsp:Transcript_107936/g.311874  ORF Transcript_107936/g.311874 Transcript_107936/m.311874 type:complete len:222 (-) Transcript_107936:100-765(-)